MTIKPRIEILNTVIFTLLFCLFSHAQTKADSIRTKNIDLLNKLENLLVNNGSFKEAVFLSELGFENKVSPLNYYSYYIKEYAKLVQFRRQSLKVVDYHQPDSNNYLLNRALYATFCKPLYIGTDSLLIKCDPFQYNFDDPQGDKDWSSTFVTGLLATHKGNCRSLAYLYKILADEAGARCWLALAPNHIYIRNYSKQAGWYNTELTSGIFPTDAWISATGYVSADAIRSGVYMDTLSNRQSIALCILDLAHGYIRQTHNYTDGVVLKCCELVLQYHAVNPMALLLKAETLQQLYVKQKEGKIEEANKTYHQMEETYLTLIKLGYREMPYDVYQQWLKNASLEKEKYRNTAIK